MRGLVLIVVVLLTVIGCSNDSNYIESADKPTYYYRSVKQLTDVIVHDIFSPPVASRIYAYAAIAGYEVMAAFDDEYKTLAGQLNELETVPSPDPNRTYSMPVAAVHAFLQTGQALIFSEQKIVEFEATILNKMKTEGNIPQSVYDRSIEYGKAMLICVPIGDAIVTIVAADSSSLGMIRYRLKKTIPALEEFF